MNLKKVGYLILSVIVYFSPTSSAAERLRQAPITNCTSRGIRMLIHSAFNKAHAHV